MLFIILSIKILKYFFLFNYKNIILIVSNFFTVLLLILFKIIIHKLYISLHL